MSEGGLGVLDKVKPKCSLSSLDAFIESLMKGWGLDDCFTMCQRVGCRGDGQGL